MGNGSGINGSGITFDKYSDIISNNSILNLGSFLTRLINNVKIEPFKNYEDNNNLLWILLIILLIRILFKKKNEL